VAAKLIKATDRVLADKGVTDARIQARAMKLRGICLEAKGDLLEALGCYEQAIALDLNVGVKRRAEQIRKSGIFPDVTPALPRKK
jgi:hypothetical protein